MRRLKLSMVLLWCIATLFWNLPGARAAPSLDQTVHVVQPGENLFRISLRYGTTVNAIMAANGLADASTVRAGQSLVIPGGASTAASTGTSTTSGGSYTVQSGDTLFSIARRHGVTLDALRQANGLSSSNTIYTGQRLRLPGSSAIVSHPVSATGDTYVVRAGDTLAKIAQRYGTTTTALARLNGIVNPSAIYPGQALRLSSSAPVISSGGGKRVIVDLSEQHLYAYQGDRLVYSFIASSGAAPSYTRVGEFRVQSKIPKAYGSTWNIWMPHWLGIYWAGSTENGIHALPILPNGQILWAGYLGRPVSYGCIVLGTYEAQLLYNWAEIGTPVSIRY